MAHAAKNPSIRLEGPDGDGIATVWIDCQDKKVNTLSVDLIPEFTAVFGKISADPRIKAIVIASGKETGFIAGADIDDLGLVRTATEGAKLSKNAQDAFRNLEKLGIPTVAAIHGDCLGGGLECRRECGRPLRDRRGHHPGHRPQSALGRPAASPDRSGLSRGHLRDRPAPRRPDLRLSAGPDNQH